MANGFIDFNKHEARCSGNKSSVQVNYAGAKSLFEWDWNFWLPSSKSENKCANMHKQGDYFEIILSKLSSESCKRLFDNQKQNYYHIKNKEWDCLYQDMLVKTCDNEAL